MRRTMEIDDWRNAVLPSFRKKSRGRPSSCTSATSSVFQTPEYYNARTMLLPNLPPLPLPSLVQQLKHTCRPHMMELGNDVIISRGMLLVGTSRSAAPSYKTAALRRGCHSLSASSQRATAGATALLRYATLYACCGLQAVITQLAKKIWQLINLHMK